MRHSFAAVLCSISLLASATPAQSPDIAPVRVIAGTVLQVRMLDTVDSAADSDGTEFHGTLTAPVLLGDEVIVRSEAEVRGLLVLLRSRSHPEGFRYELLVTHLTDHGKSYDLSASLNPSFLDPGTQPAPGSKSATK